MRLHVEELGSNAIRVALEGRMDIAGTLEIDGQFTAIAATRAKAVIVDLSQLSFIASIGIRTLVSNAKAVALRGGRMVLAAPVPQVRHIIETAGIDEIVPLFDDLSAAQAAIANG